MEGLMTDGAAVVLSARGSVMFAEEVKAEVLKGCEGGRAVGTEEVSGVEFTCLGLDHVQLFLGAEAVDNSGMELVLV